ncbi:transcriptional regulator [Ligilactobacillus salivarius]|nr:transcriptional regulator [Ligilactobacillus salivarius]
MSQTDKKISEVVLRNPQKTVDFTISELSKLAQVSDASVSRFCKNLSLSGFHQLKVELAKASQNEDNYYKELDKEYNRRNFKNRTKRDNEYFEKISDSAVCC